MRSTMPDTLNTGLPELGLTLPERRPREAV